MKKIAFVLTMIILLTFGVILSSCSQDATKTTPATEIQGYWSTNVSGVTISYKFEDGSYYGSLSAIVNNNDIDTGFSYWGTYEVNEDDSLILLTLKEDGSVSKMRYVFSEGKITHLATVTANGSDGAVLKKVSDLK